MSRIPLVFRTTALLVVLVLLPWSATAEKPQVANNPIRSHSSAAAPFANIGTWLIQFLKKNACLLDPSGSCGPGIAPQPAYADNGCGLEPDGRCTR